MHGADKISVRLLWQHLKSDFFILLSYYVEMAGRAAARLLPEQLTTT